MSRIDRARSLPTAGALLIHAVLLGVLLALPSSRAGPPTSGIRLQSVSTESFFETAREEDGGLEHIVKRAGTAGDPVVQDAPIDDHVATDDDVPFEDAAFEGPHHNAVLGTGGGAGGAFGRGGRRTGHAGGGGTSRVGGDIPSASSEVPAPEAVLARRSSLAAHTAR